MAKPTELIPFLILLALLAIVAVIIWRQSAELYEPIAKPKFVSWYRAPLRDHIEYLALMPAIDGDDGGFFYTMKLANAHRFDTYEEARKRTPVYDGSSGIEGRTGVYTVNG